MATPPYRPEAKPEPALRLDPDFQASVQKAVDGLYALYLLPEAQRAIQEHIGWGRRTAVNGVEQGGLLFGQVYRDASQGKTYGMVSAAVAGTSALGSTAFLQFPHQTWVEMLEEADCAAGDVSTAPQVIGWYHTHPGELSVFMSGTDRATQRRMFYADWHFAMVLNPQKRRWRVFHGAGCEECTGFGVRYSSGSEAGSGRDAGVVE
ncbi:MAG TPA: hypothetical protein VGB24_01270 [Longimicrobium sp.]|uniref:hypothetical protein n=1 Tax=Longimicrobium sp. TaxID=2029185 RepID=UPI002ED815CB